MKLVTDIHHIIIIIITAFVAYSAIKSEDTEALKYEWASLKRFRSSEVKGQGHF